MVCLVPSCSESQGWVWWGGESTPGSGWSDQVSTMSMNIGFFANNAIKAFYYDCSLTFNNYSGWFCFYICILSSGALRRKSPLTLELLPSSPTSITSVMRCILASMCTFWLFEKRCLVFIFLLYVISSSSWKTNFIICFQVCLQAMSIQQSIPETQVWWIRN